MTPITGTRSTSTSRSDPLGVVCCHFNPRGYQSRLANYNRFRDALKPSGVHLLTVELAFSETPFEIEPDETELIQVRGQSVMWQKERLLNLGLRKLLDDGFEHLCYLDADILFDEPDWAERVLEALGRHRFVQVFETVYRFGREAPGAVSLLRNEPPRITLKRQGLGWAARRQVFERAALYEHLIIGGADTLMFWASLLHPDWAPFHEQIEHQFEGVKARMGSAVARDIDGWARTWAGAIEGDLGFAANRIVGLPHGPRKARQYGDRAQLLRDHGFDPVRHLDREGVPLEWREPPAGLPEALSDYFRNRDEDAPESP